MTNKTILITGADGHLGQAVCERFLQGRYTVLGTIRPGKQGNQTGVEYYPADLTDADEVQKLFAAIRQRYPQLDAVACLVGGFAMNTLANTTPADLEDMWRLNFLTAFLTAQGAIPLMPKGGVLGFVGAKPALEATASQVMPYALAKAAVIQLARQINESEKSRNIRAAVVVPSIIDTPPNRAAMPDAPFSQWVTPAQLAEAFYFLFSDAGRTLQDPVLRMYGGV